MMNFPLDGASDDARQLTDGPPSATGESFNICARNTFFFLDRNNALDIAPLRGYEPSVDVSAQQPYKILGRRTIGFPVCLFFF